MKNDFAKRVDKAKQQDVKYRETPDIVVKVICRYRAELFFKISYINVLVLILIKDHFKIVILNTFILLIWMYWKNI